MLGWLAGWSVEPVLRIAHSGAALPGAAWSWPVTAFGLLGLILVCVWLIWLMPRLLKRPWLVIAIAVLQVIGLGLPPWQPGWPPTDWTVVACDVGQGDALVVRVGPGQALVVDSGPPLGGLTACLRGLGIQHLPLLLLSHGHADHVGALSELLDLVTVDLILVKTDSADWWLKPAREHQVAVRQVHYGEQIELGPVQVTVLSADPPSGQLTETDIESSAVNDASLVCRIVAGDISLLLTGDLEVAGQQALLRSGLDLAVDVLKVPHHGSARQWLDFLAASRAQIAIISVGANNSFGHPAATTLARLAALGMTVARTDQHGAIAITRRDGQLTVVSQR
jgi:competence protein ComEC